MLDTHSMDDRKNSSSNTSHLTASITSSHQAESFDLSEIIEIHDPEIDVKSIVGQIRENMTHRKSQLPSLTTFIISEERLALRAAHESLRRRVEVFGHIGSPEPGFKGKVQFFIKRVIRKLIRRHIDQERDVQDAMMNLIERLIPYLDHAQYSAECLQRIEKIEQALKQKSIIS